ncbi:MAG: glycosyltransferase family 2 protein [Sphingobium sp.]|nr:glycosyltransferase family 2 protein [Sphingobium sp.]
MPPEITVISPFFNRADRIQRSLDSLKSQTFDSFKAIIIDDGSSDNSYEVALSHANDKIEVIKQENRGFTQTMISACNSVQSEFIAVHGSGDESLPLRLQMQYEFLKKNPNVVAVGCGIQNIDEITGKTWDVIPQQTIRKGPINGDFSISHGEVMFRADAYRKAGGYRSHFRVGQASDLFRRMSRIGDFGYVSDILYRRYLALDGVNSNINNIIQREILSAISKDAHIAAIESNGNNNYSKDSLDKYGILYPYLSSPSRNMAQTLASASIKSWYGNNRQQALRLARLAIAEKLTSKAAAALIISTIGIDAMRKPLLPVVRKLTKGNDENDIDRLSGK